jgi:hypothetical protein
MQDLNRLAEYSSDWTHVTKHISPGEVLNLPGACLKFYDIHLPDSEVPAEVQAEARAFLTAQATAGKLEFRDELGFVLLHRDGPKYFMLVSIWRDKNEMWQWLSFKDTTGGFQPYPRRDSLLQPTRDIYELDATAHERRAWSRYLSSGRDAEAKRAYLEDLCTGVLV